MYAFSAILNMEGAVAINLNLNYFLFHLGVVLHLKHPCKFKLCGYVQATLIHGTVSVFGYKLDEPKKSIKIFGSDKFEPFVFETLPSSYEKNTAFLEEHLSTYLRGTDIAALNSALSENDAIIVLQELELPYKNALAYMPKEAVPVNFQSPTLFPEILRNAKITIRAVNSDDDDDKLNEIETGQINYVQASIGLEKNRVLKYLINKMLVTNKAVLCLDIDCNMNEFIPPGCVALVLIKEPIFGPNFIHKAEVIELINVGYFKPTSVLPQYKRAVSMLIRFALLRNSAEKYPWIANSFGLFPGAGTGVSVSIIKHIRPTNVITIKHPKNEWISALEKEARSMNYKYCEISNGRLLFENEQLRYKYEINRRNLMLISYFSSALPTPQNTFKTIKPYTIPLTKVILAVPNEELKIDILHLFDKSFVSLSSGISGVLAREINDVAMAVNSEVLPIMGLGVVVGIDLEKKEFQIISPLSPDQVEKTKEIALNLVPLPQQLLYEPRNDNFFRKLNEEHDRRGWKEREALVLKLKPCVRKHRNPFQKHRNLFRL